MSNLANRAVLAGVRISTWTGRKYDRKVSEEVAKQHSTAVTAGRYHKNLAQGATTLEAIRSVASAARNTHNALTLPWTNEGERILPSVGYMKWAEEMRRYKGELGALVEAFVGEYEAIKASDKATLNGLYNEADYPVDIRACFAFDTLVKPLPQAEDFRVQLGEGEVNEIKRQLTAAVEASVQEAQGEAIKRLYRAVSHMAEKLKDPKAIFRDSLTENVEELSALLPGFNLTGDVELDAIGAMVRDRLTGIKAEDLREAGVLRSNVAYDAEQIVNRMQGVWGRLDR